MNPEQPTVPQMAPAARPLWRDLLIPASIIIAGACIGAGLYFGGGATSDAGSAAVAQAPAEPADTTSEVREVTAEDHIKGSLDAPIKIVEYSDFDCPFCSRFHTAMDQIVQNNTDVAWVYRHFPLDGLHPEARTVSVVSECVGQLGGPEAFWSFTDGYFDARGDGDSSAHAVLVPQLVAAAGVADDDAFRSCVEGAEAATLVQEDVDNAVATGGRGTPWSIIIGPTGKTYPLNGALPAASIEQLIQIARDEA